MVSYRFRSSYKRNKDLIRELPILSCVLFSNVTHELLLRPSFSEVENLVGIGKDELDKKRPRLSTPPRHITENEIKAPIIPSSLTEDDSHFLLSRVLSKTGTSPKREAEVKIESEESLQEASKATGIKISSELLVLRFTPLCQSVIA